MFVDFFYKLKELGIPVNTTAFLTLNRAVALGQVSSLNDFYTVSRCTLIKSERYFDIFDQVFAYHFHGAELSDIDDIELNKIANAMLEEWLKDPKMLNNILNMDSSQLSSMNPDELIKYFKQRLKEQTERHDGGSKWIGTSGTSPVGHSGNHLEGMRVGGRSRNKSAVKIAMERRYKDYSMLGPINQTMISEALKKLKNLVPSGPMDKVNIEKSIQSTIRNGGEIEISFDKRIQDRLKIILCIDNGGWSMDPYTEIIQTLFHLSKDQFKDIKTYFFHNTIYETLWRDPERYKSPKKIKEFIKKDRDTRVLIIGDASMAPYEIMAKNGSIYAYENNNTSSIECLKFIKNIFPYSVWLNPVPINEWRYTQTINIISKIFSMFELSIDGLEEAVSYLISK